MGGCLVRQYEGSGQRQHIRYTLRILKDHFGDTKLAKIKAIHVEEFLKKMTSDRKSHSYITKMRGMLFQIMKKAEVNDLIQKNPIAVAYKQRYKDQLS